MRSIGSLADEPGPLVHPNELGCAKVFGGPLHRIDDIGPALAVPNVNGGRDPSEGINDREDAAPVSQS